MTGSEGLLRRRPELRLEVESRDNAGPVEGMTGRPPPGGSENYEALGRMLPEVARWQGQKPGPRLNRGPVMRFT
jgi:hypothetical protein